MIEIITGLLICPFIEFLNICQQIVSTRCLSVTSQPVVIYHGDAESRRVKTEFLNGRHLHLKLRLVFKELSHFIIHFEAIIHC